MPEDLRIVAASQQIIDEENCNPSRGLFRARNLLFVGLPRVRKTDPPLCKTNFVLATRITASEG